MTYRRRNAGVICHDGFLFVVGGDDGSSNLSNVEVSGFFLHLFTFQSSIRFFFLLIFLFFFQSFFSGQVYDPKTDTWKILSSVMGIGRSYAGVCIVDKPM